MIVGDFNNENSFELLKTAILYTQQEENVLSRVGFIAQRKSNLIDSLNAIIGSQAYKQKPSKFWPEINSLIETFKGIFAKFLIFI